MGGYAKLDTMTTVQEIMEYREKQAKRFEEREAARARRVADKQAMMLAMAKLHNDENMSYAEIGKKFGFTRQRVHQLLKELVADH